MLKYTICFIRQGERILLINRFKPPWMGSWNGVGGKIEPGETPLDSVRREIAEETGLYPEIVKDKGLVTWRLEGQKTGGMHLFLAELPESAPYPTPRGTEEGILDWKETGWILDPENTGITPNIPYFLPCLLERRERFEHICDYEGDHLVGFESRRIGDAQKA